MSWPRRARTRGARFEKFVESDSDEAGFHTDVAHGSEHGSCSSSECFSEEDYSPGAEKSACISMGDLASVSDDRPARKTSNAEQSYRSFRRTTFDFLSFAPDAEGPVRKASLIFHGLACVMIVGLFILESNHDHTVTTEMHWRIELVVTIIWGVEYAARIWSCIDDPALDLQSLSCSGRCKARAMFSLSFMAVMDALSLLSLVGNLCIESTNCRDGVSSLRMLRLLTLYRIERDFRIFSPVASVIMDKKAQLLATLGIAMFVLSVAAVIMFYIEAPTNDQFSSVVLAMWWGVTALTTVGYGDIVPQTFLGRVVASIVAFMGTGIFGLFAGILADGFREAFRRDRRFRTREDDADENPPPERTSPVQERLANVERDVSLLRGEVHEMITLMKRLLPDSGATVEI